MRLMRPSSLHLQSEGLHAAILEPKKESSQSKTSSVTCNMLHQAAFDEYFVTCVMLLAVCTSCVGGCILFLQNQQRYMEGENGNCVKTAPSVLQEEAINWKGRVVQVPSAPMHYT